PASASAASGRGMAAMAFAWPKCGASHNAAVSKAASDAVRVMGPIVSNVCDKGNVPSRLIRPLVVFRPVMPLREEGVRTEPPVSVPIAQGARPAATATPEPLDEPPGIRCSVMSQGFQGVPINGLVPQPPNANSTICVLPKITAPAASSFFTI